MTRDTFSRFSPPDRGRFGDNEYRSGGDARPDSESGRAAITLYQHKETPGALLLSRTGDSRQAHWIPKSLVTEPDAPEPIRIKGVQLLTGLFRIEAWKLSELGWQGRDEDESQSELSF